MKQEERKQVIKEIILWCKSGKQDVDNGVDEITLLIDQQNKELQKEVKELKEKNSHQMKIISGQAENITQLKTKLEEANKEVERLKEYVGFYDYCKEEEPFVVDRFVDSLKDTLNK